MTRNSSCSGARSGSREKGYHIGLAGRSHHLDGDSHDPLTSEIHQTHKLKTTAKRFDSCKIALGKNGNEVGTNALTQYQPQKGAGS